MKIPVLVAVIITWNVFCFIDFIHFFDATHKIVIGGRGARLALGFMFTFNVLLLVSGPVQKLVLKEGRSVRDIRPLLFLIIFITGIMFTAFTFLADTIAK